MHVSASFLIRTQIRSHAREKTLSLSLSLSVTHFPPERFTHVFSPEFYILYEYMLVYEEKLKLLLPFFLSFSFIFIWWCS